MPEGHSSRSCSRWRSPAATRASSIRRGRSGAAQQRTILINSLAIMLAIVVPTIVATLGFAWWFRASNTRARYRPDLGLFRPHRARRLVDPAAGDHPARRRRLDRLARPRSGQAAGDRQTQAARGPGRLARLEVAVHLSGPGRRERQPARRSGRRAAPFLADLGERDERVLRPAARQHDLHDERHDDAAATCRPTSPGTFRGLSASSAATASPTCISTSRRCRAEQFDAWVDATRGTRRRRSTPRATPSWPSRALNVAPFTYRAVEPDLFQQIVTQTLPPGPGPRSARPTPSVSPRTGGLNMLGQAELGRDPVRPADPDGRVGRRRRSSSLGVLAWVTLKG